MKIKEINSVLHSNMRVLHDNRKQTCSCSFLQLNTLYIYSDFVFLFVNLSAPINIKIITSFNIQISSNCTKNLRKYIPLQDQIFYFQIYNRSLICTVSDYWITFTMEIESFQYCKRFNVDFDLSMYIYLCIYVST